MCARPARARATTQLRLKPWPERRELCLLAVSGSPAARSLQAAGRGNMIVMDAEAAAQPPPLPSPSLSLPLPFLFLSSPSPPPLPPSGPWIREASLYVKCSPTLEDIHAGPCVDADWCRRPGFGHPAGVHRHGRARFRYADLSASPWSRGCFAFRAGCAEAARRRGCGD